MESHLLYDVYAHLLEMSTFLFASRLHFPLARPNLVPRSRPTRWLASMRPQPSDCEEDQHEQPLEKSLGGFLGQ
jgi:hypothetical protein